MSPLCRIGIRLRLLTLAVNKTNRSLPCELRLAIMSRLGPLGSPGLSVISPCFPDLLVLVIPLTASLHTSVKAVKFLTSTRRLVLLYHATSTLIQVLLQFDLALDSP